MGYGCCPDLTEADYIFGRKEAEKFAKKIYNEMTLENYKTYLSEAYYESISPTLPRGWWHRH